MISVAGDFSVADVFNDFNDFSVSLATLEINSLATHKIPISVHL